MVSGIETMNQTKNTCAILTYKVVGFNFTDMSTKEKKVTSSSNVVTQQMKDYLKTINKGAMLTFTDIKYLTPQGDTVTSPIYRVFTYDSPKGYLMQL